MTLTEQWKKGELESGYYYIVVKRVEFPNRIDFYNSSVTAWSYHSNDVIKQVLEPVPSYQEYLENESHCAIYIDVNKWLKDENQQLKGLLKTCREMLEEYQYSEGDFTIGDNAEIDTSLLLKMIDNVIGEKK